MATKLGGGSGSNLPFNSHNMKRITLNDDPRDYLLWFVSMGRTVEIVDIQVGSQRGVGKGRELVEKLLSQIPKTTSTVFAITRISNTVAHQFYESLGFRILGRLHHFYREAGDQIESALVYGKDV